MWRWVNAKHHNGKSLGRCYRRDVGRFYQHAFFRYGDARFASEGQSNMKLRSFIEGSVQHPPASGQFVVDDQSALHHLLAAYRFGTQRGPVACTVTRWLHP